MAHDFERAKNEWNQADISLPWCQIASITVEPQASNLSISYAPTKHHETNNNLKAQWWIIKYGAGVIQLKACLEHESVSKLAGCRIFHFCFTRLSFYKIK